MGTRVIPMKFSELHHLFLDMDPGSIALLPVLDDFHEGVMITDDKGVLLYMNAAQAKMDDFEITDAVGREVTDLYLVDEGASPIMTCINSGRAVRNLACYYRTHLGKVVNSIHNIYPLFSGGRLVGTVCCVTNYRSVEQRFTTIGKKKTSKALPTYGVSPDSFTPRTHKNGTRYTFDDIVGSDKDLLGAVKAARLAAESPSPILLFGETGTGKELFAQSIHNRSPRSAKPYVAINCTAIPENLLEGMLFGTAKGAFTGAINKLGLLEKADGGTLFLDEVNAMPPALQAKLLRFLQERTLRRVGATREIAVDVKVISSTNVSPHTAIDTGALRADLFYRLAVVYIHIPRLMERRGDLTPLVAHFLHRINIRLGRRVTAVSMEAMELFENHSWPGNVRELAHVIEGAMNMLGAEETLATHHLRMPLANSGAFVVPPWEGEGGGGRASAGAASTPYHGRLRMVLPSGEERATARAGGRSLAETKQAHEVEAIRQALSASKGNAARAARSLGISPQLLNYKLKRFGIDRKSFVPR